ncbi:MAG: hypothetical protein ACLFVX_03875, partial [Archaeoglobaceae archaeon]
NGVECCQENADCDNGLYCDGQEVCSNNECNNGTQVDCSEYDISAIDTCDNNPDNNPFTLDYREAFESICDDNIDSCTNGDSEIGHTCDTDRCGAECEVDSDCEDECSQDQCIDSDGDGLNDYEELYIYHTDPFDSDTDNDGESDGDDDHPLDPGSSANAPHSPSNPSTPQTINTTSQTPTQTPTPTQASASPANTTPTETPPRSLPFVGVLGVIMAMIAAVGWWRSRNR